MSPTSGKQTKHKTAKIKTEKNKKRNNIDNFRILSLPGYIPPLFGYHRENLESLHLQVILTHEYLHILNFYNSLLLILIGGLYNFSSFYEEEQFFSGQNIILLREPLSARKSV